MKNKTCGECRYMLHKDTFEVCTLCMTETSIFDLERLENGAWVK